ncbi:MAG: glycosyltransferase [Rhodobacteraceae bacterium]|jgi:glycosyltransferase involved in cell wall biosynthesis|nr:glycosyltransferase [Paracoccaceae bacterium]
MTARKVAMVINALGSGGVPEAVLNLCTHLPRERYAPQVFALKPEDGQDSGTRHRFAAAGVPVTVATATDGKIGTVAELADWLSDQGIAILHSHSYRPNLYARMAGAICRPRGLHIVAHYHNQYDDKWPAGSPALRLERQLAGVTDAMIAVSDNVRSHVAQAIGVDESRIRLVPNGIAADKVRKLDRATARRQMGLQPGDLAIGVIGRICAQKGQEDMVEAALLLRQTRPEAVVLLIGAAEDAALSSRLAARIAAAGASTTIRFIGHMPDIAPAYAALDILAAPSRWEGFGLMLVEAMAAGLPVVATDAGAIAEVTGGAAQLVPIGDPTAMAAALAALDMQKRTALAKAGLARAQAFQWPAAAARLAAIYDGLPCH